jgi:hypothetical protein
LMCYPRSHYILDYITTVFNTIISTIHMLSLLRKRIEGCSVFIIFLFLRRSFK